MGEDMSTERPYYKFSELAKKHSISQDELLGRATTGELTLSILFDGYLCKGKYFADHIKQPDSFTLVAPKEKFYEQPLSPLQHQVSSLGDILRQYAIERMDDNQRCLAGPYDGVIVHIRSEDVVRFLISNEDPVEIRFVIFENSIHTLQKKLFTYPMLKRSELLVLNEEAERFQKMLFEVEDTQTRIEEVKKEKPIQGTNTGGRPNVSITEAVKWAYDKLTESGNTELIKPRKLTGFLEYLKECVTEGNPNYSDYVSERIKEIKGIGGDCKIIMQNITDQEKANFVTTRKNYFKKKVHISTILSDLRKQK